MTAYQIRLRATDGKGLYSDYTDTLSFETAGDPTVPFASELIFPANGAKEGIANGINFTRKNDRKAYGGDVSYTLYLGTDAENLTEAASGLTATEWNCTTLEANKTYYWRVDATNSLGTTPSEVYSFTTTAGGVLFYTDFHTCPASYAEKFGSRTDNPNVFNAANQRVEFDGMVIGSGSNAIRVVAMSGCFSEDLNENYGPASEEDRGATAKALQFYTTKAGGYIETPEVQGPCVLTVYFGNTGSSQQTVKIVTIAGGEESTESYAIGAKSASSNTPRPTPTPVQSSSASTPTARVQHQRHPRGALRCPRRRPAPRTHLRRTEQLDRLHRRQHQPRLQPGSQI